MSYIAIITARGGSKRIPKKNIKEFCGKPIIAYSIEAALESGRFDTVMVSTDSTEIADIAKKYGAEVPFFRSEKTSNDYAITRDVLREVLEEYEKLGKTFAEVCCIYPTAPFVTAKRICSAMDRFLESDADVLIPVVRYSFPPQRAFVLDGEKIIYKWPENYAKRSQDLEPFFHDAGQFYIHTASSILSDIELSNQKIVPFELDELEVQDIDNETDWKLAELKYKLLHGEL